MIEAALRDLALDPLYDRLTPAYRRTLVAAAFDLGAAAARRFAARPAAALAAELGVAVKRSEADSVVGGHELRAESDPGRRQVKLYLPALRKLAAGGRVTEAQAEEVALAHELFHCLEEQLDFGALPRFMLWKLGPWERRVLPLRVREIAAHAFAMEVAGVEVYPGEL